MVISVALKAKFWLEKNCVLVLYLPLPSDQPRASDLSPVFTSKKLGGKKKIEIHELLHQNVGGSLLARKKKSYIHRSRETNVFRI